MNCHTDPDLLLFFAAQSSDSDSDRRESSAENSPSEQKNSEQNDAAAVVPVSSCKDEAPPDVPVTSGKDEAQVHAPTNQDRARTITARRNPLAQSSTGVFTADDTPPAPEILRSGLIHCLQCNIVFSSFGDLLAHDAHDTRHIARVRGHPDPGFGCLICRLRLKRMDCVISHYHKHHPNMCRLSQKGVKTPKIESGHPLGDHSSSEEGSSKDSSGEEYSGAESTDEDDRMDDDDETPGLLNFLVAAASGPSSNTRNFRLRKPSRKGSLADEKNYLPKKLKRRKTRSKKRSRNKRKKPGNACLPCYCTNKRCDRGSPCDRCVRGHRDCVPRKQPPKVNQACAPCQKRKACCDDGRPCQRCIRLGDVEKCVDVPHKKAGRPRKNAARTQAQDSGDSYKPNDQRTTTKRIVPPPRNTSPKRQRTAPHHEPLIVPRVYNTRSKGCSNLVPATPRPAQPQRQPSTPVVLPPYRGAPPPPINRPTQQMRTGINLPIVNTTQAVQVAPTNRKRMRVSAPPTPNPKQFLYRSTPQYMTARNLAPPPPPPMTTPPPPMTTPPRQIRGLPQLLVNIPLIHPVHVLPPPSGSATPPTSGNLLHRAVLPTPSFNRHMAPQYSQIQNSLPTQSGLGVTRRCNGVVFPTAPLTQIMSNPSRTQSYFPQPLLRFSPHLSEYTRATSECRPPNTTHGSTPPPPPPPPPMT